MNRNDGPSPAVKKNLLRLGVLAIALLYGLSSLNPAAFKSAFRPALPVAEAAAETAVASGESPTASSIGEEAIPVPGNMAHGQTHKCCCKHAGNKCEMGCCAAGNDIVPGEPCFRVCGGEGTSESQPPSLDNHLALADAGFFPRRASAPCFPSPVQAPLSLPLQPPEKVPIV